MPAIDVNGRIEPGTVAALDRLARWDLASVDTIRSSYLAIAAPKVPADPRVTRTDAVIPGRDGRPDVRVRWYRPVAAGRGPPPAPAAGALPCLVWLHGGGYIMGTL